jgi:NitT/TauT family transport system substrate-binding protein
MTGMRADRIVRRMCLAIAIAAMLVTGPARAQTAVKFALDFRFEGPAAPFLLALDKNYFKAEGLDVTIDPGAGSLEPVTRVASGGYDMGFGDINALIKLRDQNGASAPRAVFMVYNKPPFAIVARRSRGVSMPKDLENKKLAAPAGDAAFAQWRIFAKANDIDISKVSIDTIAFPVREPMLAAGQVDAITGFSFSTFITLKDRGVALDDIVVMLMADYGVNLYGNAIIVSQKFATEKPQVVRAFLRAYLKGLKDTIKDPARAVDSVISRNSAANKDVEIERLRMAIRDNILTPEVKANGFGGVDTRRLNQAIDQIALTFDFRSKPKASEVFDESFLPAAVDRNAN